MKNREIKFRGKRKDNSEWIVGNLFISDTLIGGVYICNETTYVDFFPCIDEEGNEDPNKQDGVAIGRFYEVIPETVGQYTGLKDRNGKYIYEGDIVSIDGRVAVIKYHARLAFVLRYIETDGYDFYHGGMVIEIIGNKYENPELLK